jgi:hypothetical protein
VVQPGNLCKYVALSYVWGDVDIYRAQSRDFITVPDSQGAESSQARYLPLQGISPCQNILDAISIVEAIGEKYLRVDTLCILQDDPEDVATVLENMDKIFELAILTIIAASGTNADSGLIERKGTFSSVTGFVEGIGLVEIKRWPTDLRECPWSQRGWCYQEDHFSTKCLIFAYNRVFYECPSGYWVETRPRGRLGRALRDRVKPIRTDGELVSNSPVDGGPTLDFEEYADHVRAYSKRKLTFENDILNAFSGIMVQMSERSGSPFCWGLPIDHFMSALMWSRSKDTKRRKTCSDQENAVSFSSWSWAGWTGSFLYEAFFYNGFTFMPEHYDSSIVWPWEQHCGIPTGKEVFQTGRLRVRGEITTLRAATVQKDFRREIKGSGAYPEYAWGIHEHLLLGVERETKLYISQRSRRCYTLAIAEREDGIYERVGWLVISYGTWEDATPERRLICLG